MYSMVTSVTGSQLSSRIRREADIANRRRREIEHLYAFSQKLLGEGNVIQLMNAIPNHIVDAFESGAASLFLADKQKFYRSGYGTLQLEEEQLRLAYEREEPYVDTARGFCYGPVRLGMKSIGSFGISGKLSGTMNAALLASANSGLRHSWPELNSTNFSPNSFAIRVA